MKSLISASLIIFSTQVCLAELPWNAREIETLDQFSQCQQTRLRQIQEALQVIETDLELSKSLQNQIESRIDQRSSTRNFVSGLFAFNDGGGISVNSHIKKTADSPFSSAFSKLSVLRNFDRLAKRERSDLKSLIQIPEGWLYLKTNHLKSAVSSTVVRELETQGRAILDKSAEEMNRIAIQYNFDGGTDINSELADCSTELENTISLLKAANLR